MVNRITTSISLVVSMGVIMASLWVYKTPSARHCLNRISFRLLLGVIVLQAGYCICYLILFIHVSKAGNLQIFDIDLVFAKGEGCVCVRVLGAGAKRTAPDSSDIWLKLYIRNVLSPRPFVQVRRLPLHQAAQPSLCL